MIYSYSPLLKARQKKKKKPAFPNVHLQTPFDAVVRQYHHMYSSGPWLL